MSATENPEYDSIRTLEISTNGFLFIAAIAVESNGDTNIHFRKNSEVIIKISDPKFNDEFLELASSWSSGGVILTSFRPYQYERLIIYWGYTIFVYHVYTQWRQTSVCSIKLP